MSSMPKKETIIEIPYDANEKCDRFDSSPAADIVGEMLCFGCVMKDAFDDHCNDN